MDLEIVEFLNSGQNCWLYLLIHKSLDLLMADSNPTLSKTIFSISVYFTEIKFHENSIVSLISKFLLQKTEKVIFYKMMSNLRHLDRDNLSYIPLA